MGKFFFCLLFAAAAFSTQAGPVVVVAPHIQAPIVMHVPQVQLPHGQSLATTQQFRSLYNPLGNNPVVNVPGEQASPAFQPRTQVGVSAKSLPLGTTIAAADRTAVNGYSVGQVRQVQQTLHRMGYYNGNVDGDFGPLTQTALERYQLRAGEPVTGTLTLGTMGRLGVSGK
jgi:peptidoglycan hydrolase-like protein with peptidoglycan-binding domain